MKKFIKKIGIAVAALAMVTGIATVSDVKDVYADNTVNVSVNLTPEAGKTASDYTVKISTVYSGEVGSEKFEDKQYSWKFANKSEGQDDCDTVTIYIQKDGEGQTIYTESKEVTMDMTEVTFDVDLTKVAAETTDSNVDANTDTTVDDGKTPVIDKKEKMDDPDKDYSVGTVTVIILDVIFLVALGGGAYYFFSKEKKPLKK